MYGGVVVMYPPQAIIDVVGVKLFMVAQFGVYIMITGRWGVLPTTSAQVWGLY